MGSKSFRKLAFWNKQPAQRVARGEGKMVNGNFYEFNAADKAHNKAAAANAGMEYQDVSGASQLGHFTGGGAETLLEGSKKKKQAVSTLLGGGGILGG